MSTQVIRAFVRTYSGNAMNCFCESNHGIFVTPTTKNAPEKCLRRGLFRHGGPESPLGGDFRPLVGCGSVRYGRPPTGMSAVWCFRCAADEHTVVGRWVGPAAVRLRSGYPVGTCWWSRDHDTIGCLEPTGRRAAGRRLGRPGSAIPRCRRGPRRTGIGRKQQVGPTGIGRRPAEILRVRTRFVRRSARAISRERGHYLDHFNRKSRNVIDAGSARNF